MLTEGWGGVTIEWGVGYNTIEWGGEVGGFSEFGNLGEGVLIT